MAAEDFADEMYNITAGRKNGNGQAVLGRRYNLVDNYGTEVSVPRSTAVTVYYDTRGRRPDTLLVFQVRTGGVSMQYKMKRNGKLVAKNLDTYRGVASGRPRPRTVGSGD